MSRVVAGANPRFEEMNEPTDLPPHYTSLSLRNFRAFKRLEQMPMAPLTFLVGPNSSGKSSLFHAFLLIAQSALLPGGYKTFVPSWVGRMVDLGSYQDAVFSHNESLGIQISVGVAIQPTKSTLRARKPTIEFCFELRSDNTFAGYVAKVSMSDVRSGQSAHISRNATGTRLELKSLGRPRRLSSTTGTFQSPFELLGNNITTELRHRGKGKAGWQRLARHLQSPAYLDFSLGTDRVSSGREAPKRWYPITGPGSMRGQVFDAVKPEFIRQTKSRKSRRIGQRTLGDILRALDIATRISVSTKSGAVQITDSVTRISSNLIDVGYGASQAIPVIAACLQGGAGPLFVEQPEIHLHPRAQGEIGDLLCATSIHRQVVVETHSPRIINRARILIAQGKLDPKHVVVNFINRTKSGSMFTTIPILQNGDFGVEWPEGFFDERYQDTLSLLKAQSALKAR